MRSTRAQHASAAQTILASIRQVLEFVFFFGFCSFCFAFRFHSILSVHCVAILSDLWSTAGRTWKWLSISAFHFVISIEKHSGLFNVTNKYNVNKTVAFKFVNNFSFHFSSSLFHIDSGSVHVTFVRTLVISIQPHRSTTYADGGKRK